MIKHNHDTTYVTKPGDTFTGKVNIIKSESSHHTMEETMAHNITTGQQV